MGLCFLGEVFTQMWAKGVFGGGAGGGGGINHGTLIYEGVMLERGGRLF